MESLLSLNQVADLLNIPVLTVRYYVRLRKIPFIKFGKQLRFRKRDIDLWVESHLQKVFELKPLNH